MDDPRAAEVATPDDRFPKEHRLLPAAGTAGRRPVFRALARSAATVALLLVLYFRLPLTRPVRWTTGAILLSGLALIALVVAWQIRSVMRSRFPVLRAMETLSMTLPIFLILFAAVYVIMVREDPHAFTQELTRIDALYFVVTVFATVGFGDISPVSELARVVVTVQMVCDLLVLGVVVRAMLLAVQRADIRRRPGPAPEDPPGT